MCTAGNGVINISGIKLLAKAENTMAILSAIWPVSASQSAAK